MKRWIRKKDKGKNKIGGGRYWNYWDWSTKEEKAFISKNKK